WVTMLYPPVLLMLLSHLAPGPFNALWRLIGYCAFLGISLAAVASMTRWELGLQVQFWRFSWLAAWATPIVVLAAALGPSRHAVDSVAHRILIATSIPVLWVLLSSWLPAVSLLA